MGIETQYEVTVKLLASLNVSQSATENKLHLDDYGGPEYLAKNMNVNSKSGLMREQVPHQKRIFGANFFPDSPMESYWSLLLEALSDSTLVILMIAAVVSLVIGTYQDPVVGWVEGAAILIAVFAVSSISAGNDYSKQLQFRDLEKNSAKDEEISILRESNIDRYPITDVVVGDIIVLTVSRSAPAALHQERAVTSAAPPSALTFICPSTLLPSRPLHPFLSLFYRLATWSPPTASSSTTARWWPTKPRSRARATT